MKTFISQQRLSSRFVAAVAIVALLLSAFPASFFVAEAASSSVPLPFSEDFESGFGQWSDAGSWALQGPIPSSSGKYVQAMNNYGAVGELGVTLSTLGYENIKVSFRYRGNLESGSSVRAYLIGGGETKSFAPMNSTTAGDDEWKNFSLSFTSNTGFNDNTNLRLSFSGSVLDGKTLMIDDITVTGDPITAPVNSTVIIKKVVEDYDEDWNFNFTTSFGSFGLTETENKMVYTNIVPGTYYIEEDVLDYLPAGWTLSDVTCDKPFTRDGRTADFTLVGGETITCTFTNTPPVATAAPTYIITGSKFNDTNGDGEWNEGELAMSGWGIELTQGDAANRYATTGENGTYSFTVEQGFYQVSEIQQAGWEQTATISENADGPTCYIDIDAQSPSTFTCTFGNQVIPDDRLAVTGHKWSDVNNNGIKDDSEVGVKGWKITATDTDGDNSPVTTETNSDGTYTLLLPPNANWNISEEVRAGWTQTAVFENEERLSLDGNTACNISTYGEDYMYASMVMLSDNPVAVPAKTNRCDFLNYETPRRSGGSTGTRVKDRAPRGEVLGAATTTPQCSVYLTDYMRLGNAASSSEVIKLQVFLNAVGIKAPLTGIFDAGTDASVRTFQAQHKAEVLTPWYNAKIVSHENPTGWVYQLTRWKINNIVCPGSEAYPVLN